MMKPAGVSKVMKFALKVEERNAYNQRKQWGLKVGLHKEHGLNGRLISPKNNEAKRENCSSRSRYHDRLWGHS